MLENNITNNFVQNEFSVSEISKKIKSLLERNIGIIKIKGEISGLKIATSGHGYFSLKDDQAVISATCWRHSLAKLDFKLSEGLEVIVRGKITSYAGQSKYQISVENIEPSGIGAFMRILTERRTKFTTEGLFNKEKKQKIPFLPKKIGVITSISGAVIKDIIHRISDRCPVHIIIWPVAVQGENSSNEVTKAINGFNQLDINKKPDLLIIARGGGSIEDLWSFNEENVVRAVYNSKIPTISAIGHETDYTMIDLVADLRAPTPTAAAEFAVPVAKNLKDSLQIMHNQIQAKLNNLYKFYYQKIYINHKALNQVTNLIEYYTQKIDDYSFRLLGSLPSLLKQKNIALTSFSINRFKPSKILNYKYLQHQNIYNLLITKKIHLFNEFQYKLNLQNSLLNSLDYKNVLKRGYAMIQDKDGKYISTIKEVLKTPILTIKMHDGSIKKDISKKHEL